MKKNLTREIADELDILDDMLSTLVELLENKGIITQEEYENSLRMKIEQKAKKKSFRDVQFGK
jgi:DNA-binding HxlR family transcriptional regulator